MVLLLFYCLFFLSFENTEVTIWFDSAFGGRKGDCPRLCRAATISQTITDKYNLEYS